MRGNEHGSGVLERLAAWLVVLVVVGLLLQAVVAFIAAYALWIVLAVVVLIVGALVVQRLFY